jgi:hypothetical protein
MLDAEERAVMHHIGAAMGGILDMGLKTQADGVSNLSLELCAAVHVLQGFVVQHMLQRLAPAEWGSWYDDEALAEQEAGEAVPSARDGVAFVGVEREPEYAALARARVTWWAEHREEGLALMRELRSAERRREATAEAGQMDLFGAPAPADGGRDPSRDGGTHVS